jgi:hypothetical protein
MSRSEASMDTYRVHVSTDLGGDPDDIQSLYRLIHYSDILRVEGISSCTGPGSDPSAELIREWIRRVDVEHLRERGYSELMTESELLDVTVQGPTEPRAPFEGGETPGSERLIERANAATNGDGDGDEPLWVLVWGSLTGVAQALHDDPDIADRIRIYYISSTNTQHDPEARDWVDEFMRTERPDLWWVESGRLPKWGAETFRGVHLGGVQRDEWGRRAFLDEHVRGRGSTHDGEFDERCGDAFPTATATGMERLGVDDGQPKEGILKEGDSPSMLYLLSPVLGDVGDVDDPTRPNWGGRYRRPEPERVPNYYTDLDADVAACLRTINRWRVDFLADWRDRWERYDEE